jgi:hypothetical protein
MFFTSFVTAKLITLLYGLSIACRMLRSYSTRARIARPLTASEIRGGKLLFPFPSVRSCAIRTANGDDRV